jgi:hypothetical protein
VCSGVHRQGGTTSPDTKEKNGVLKPGTTKNNATRVCSVAHKQCESNSHAALENSALPYPGEVKTPATQEKTGLIIRANKKQRHAGV